MVDLFLHIDSVPASARAAATGSQGFKLTGKLGDDAVGLRIYFINGGSYVTPDVVNSNLELKVAGEFADTATVRAVSSTVANDGTNDYVDINLDLSGSALNLLLNPAVGTAKYSVILMAEFSWEDTAGDTYSSQTFLFKIFNDIVKTLELTPIP